MLTDLEVLKIATAIVAKLTTDDKFISKIAKSVDKKNEKLVNASRAAEILGITRKTVCQIAEYLGGIKGDGKSSHWVFKEDGLVDRYIEYKNTKS